MSDFSERLIELRGRCLRCWADEISDIFPKRWNRKIAADVMDRHGNPPHSEWCQKEKTIAQQASHKGESNGE